MSDLDKSLEKLQPPIEIQAEAVSADALAGIIDNFILREGTDYGRDEVKHETKVAGIRKQIATGEVKIIYDSNTESVSLLTRVEWVRLRDSVGA